MSLGKPLQRTARLEQALIPTNSNCGLEMYLSVGRMGLSDLKGVVLDLGSGDLDRFSREAATEGISVISVDPFLVTARQRHHVTSGIHTEFNWYTRLPWANRSIAALAQELPVKDESVDTIVSCAAIPGYLDPDDYPAHLSEIQRILRPGGFAKLFPLIEVEEAPYVRDRYVSALAESGLKYSIDQVALAGTMADADYEIVTIRK